MPTIFSPESDSAIQAERERVGNITKVSGKYLAENRLPSAGNTITAEGAAGIMQLQATAIASGWSGDKLDLELMRASFPTTNGPGIPVMLEGRGPAIHSHSRQPTELTAIEAGLALHCHLPSPDKAYGERVVHGAERLGITSMIDAARLCAQLKGVEFNPRSKDSILQAAFSTADFPTLISNVANKMLEQTYREYPSTAMRVARPLDANDFKEHTGVRLTGDARMEQVGRTGELKHSLLADQSFKYQIATYGRIWGISRQDIIDDDTKGLDELPRLTARGANLAIEEVFWTLVLANTGNFFHADNRNLIGDALDGDGLGVGVQTMLEQVDTFKKPINVVPRFVAVPPALKVIADQLYTSRTFLVGGGDTTNTQRVTTMNSFYGLYEPVAVPWMGSKGGITNGSDSHWLLFGDPNDVAAFGLAFLQSQKTPTIEFVDQPPSVLGIGLRGYIDFGACQVDERGAVYSTGQGGSN